MKRQPEELEKTCHPLQTGARIYKEQQKLITKKWSVNNRGKQTTVLLPSCRDQSCDELRCTSASVTGCKFLRARAQMVQLGHTVVLFPAFGGASRMISKMATLASLSPALFKVPFPHIHTNRNHHLYPWRYDINKWFKSEFLS